MSYRRAVGKHRRKLRRVLAKLTTKARQRWPGAVVYRAELVFGVVAGKRLEGTWIGYVRGAA